MINKNFVKYTTTENAARQPRKTSQ